MKQIYEVCYLYFGRTAGNVVRSEQVRLSSLKATEEEQSCEERHVHLQRFATKRLGFGHQQRCFHFSRPRNFLPQKLGQKERDRKIWVHAARMQRSNVCRKQQQVLDDEFFLLASTKQTDGQLMVAS